MSYDIEHQCNNTRRFKSTPPIIIFSTPQPAFTYSKLTIEILEQGVKYVQSEQ